MRFVTSQMPSPRIRLNDVWANKSQKGPDEKLQKNIKIITLPPYSPKLNPAENLWDIVKDGI